MSHAPPGDVERDIPLEREGQYTRLDELGRGGQSVVFRAFDEFITREVALKELITSRLAGDSETSTPVTEETAATLRRRFLREARLTARLDHPGIVSVLELARRLDGTTFCVQKLVRGETLKQRLARCASLSERLQQLPHLIAACQAVAYAHSHQVIHRDLKPSNIMAGPFGETVVVDWGLAKQQSDNEEVLDLLVPPSAEPGLTVAGAALGTPAYMSPEQARGELQAIDSRSDVFSLGAVLYEMLTGRPPFTGSTSEHVVENASAGNVYPVATLAPDAPPELAAIAERALRPLPADRYSNAGELARELSAYFTGGRVRAYQYGSWELVRKFVARNRALSAVSVAALGVLLVSAATIAWQLHGARLNLAASFLERAHAAEQKADWGKAAGYYAASRLHHDSLEGRWGAALARESIPRRLFARSSADRSYLDVGYDRDGRAIVLALEAGQVIVRDLESGLERWRHRASGSITDASFSPGGLVRVLEGGHLTYLDGTTGGPLETFDMTERYPCLSGPPTRQVLVGRGTVTAPGPDGKERSWKVAIRPVCSVSPDGQRLAFRDLDGVVHVWDVEGRKELDTRSAPDASALFFTAHGLAAIRSRWVQLFGGPEGDFSVVLPGRGNSPRDPTGSVNAVSSDGHQLVVSTLSSSQADLVDLRTRSVVSSVSFAAGIPRFVFSPAGDRLLVAGLGDGRTLTAWEIAVPSASRAFPGTPLMSVRASQDAHRLLLNLVGPADPRFELRDESGTLLRTGAVGRPGLAVFLSADGRRIAVSTAHGARVLDAESGRELGLVDCEKCYRLGLSADGSRLLTGSEVRLAVWDVAKAQLVWSETERLGRPDGPLHMSGDGRSVLWGRDRTLYVHRDGVPQDKELQLDQRVTSAAFSYDGTRLAAVTAGTVGVWDSATLALRWRLRNPSWGPQFILWSGDDSAVMINYVAQGVALHDSGTGERFATIPVRKPGALGGQEVVLPDLRHRISLGDSIWELASLAPPDDGPPRESLERVLTEAGLEMRGVELVDAPPAPSPGGDLSR